MQAEAAAEAKHYKTLTTREGQRMLEEEKALVRAYRDGLNASTKGLVLKLEREKAAAHHCFQLFDVDCSGTIEDSELQVRSADDGW